MLPENVFLLKNPLAFWYTPLALHLLLRGFFHLDVDKPVENVQNFFIHLLCSTIM